MSQPATLPTTSSSHSQAGLAMAKPPIVVTRTGQLRGNRTDGVFVFKGIPYAAPPFGALRFEPPQPPAPWSGVRDALSFGAEPPQPRPDAQTATLVPDPAVPGEDCLNLNVWTPDLESSGLPVLVWIPGGMFEVCSGAAYDGSRFARDGVVCVTINYRVGAEGFLYLGDGSPNRGLLDQIAALTWVRDNIAAFGGDPANVTVFGESAGAMSIGTLLSMPRAQGLFRRAICESGASHQVMSVATAQRSAQRLAEQLGVENSRRGFASVPLERFVAAQVEMKAELFAHPDPARWGLEVIPSLLSWQPVVDGDIVPDYPIERIAASASADVDVLVGTNTEDWRLFAVLNGLIDRVTDEILSAPIEVHGFKTLAAYGLTADTALPAYRAKYPGASPGDLLGAAQTDWWCRIPAIRLAEAHAAKAGATYMYEFAWPSPAFDGRLGAVHALEIAFVFDTLDKGTNQMVGALLGASPPQGLANTMHAAWVAFATSGDPGWPKYDRDRRATMRFNAISQVVDDPRAWERQLWEGVR